MDSLFTHGHRQLLGTQCSGLSAAWRRAAEDAARHAGTAGDVPAAACVPARGLRLLSWALAAGVLTAALVGGLTQGPADDAITAAVPLASAPLLASAE